MRLCSLLNEFTQLALELAVCGAVVSGEFVPARITTEFLFLGLLLFNFERLCTVHTFTAFPLFAGGLRCFWRGFDYWLCYLLASDCGVFPASGRWFSLLGHRLSIS